MYDTTKYHNLSDRIILKLQFIQLPPKHTDVHRNMLLQGKKTWPWLPVLSAGVLLVVYLVAMDLNRGSTYLNRLLEQKQKSTVLNGSPRYAISTIVLTPNYQETAMALCMSIRSSFPEKILPSDIDLVVYVPENAQGRNVSADLLTCCFSQLHKVPLINVSQPPSFDRFKEQYIKLNLWQQTQYERLLYLDADFIVVTIDPLIDILRHSNIEFGAVQDWNNGAWSTHWNGGLFVLKPSNETFEALVTNVEPFIEQRRFNTDMAEQGYLSAYFDRLGYTLPTTYNLNLAIKYQAPEIWERYVGDAVAIHYTWVKPWEHPDEQDSFPNSLWWTHSGQVHSECPLLAGMHGFA